MLDREAARRGGLVAAVVHAGVDQVQVRDRSLEGEALLQLVDDVRDATRRGAQGRGAPARVLVNRRSDVALAAGVDGVHLGFDGVTAGEARALLGADAWIGVSTHSVQEVAHEAEAAASAEGARYVHLAPIHAPLSKAASRPALGTAALSRAARAAGARLPVIAQGGIDAGNARAARDAGAAGIAVTGAILQADDPVAATRALREALDG